MKISGKEFKIPTYTYEVYIPGGEEGAEGINFVFGPSKNFERFERLCKMPEPPLVTRPGQPPEADYKHPKYRQDLLKYGERRIQYIFLESIRYTPELDWETIDSEDPTTWGNYRTELLSAGLTDADIERLYGAVLAVNNLDEEQIRVARDRFLALKQAKDEALQSYHTEEPATTELGEPANDLDSSPPELETVGTTAQ